ncbi:DUF4424 domain-containing protein [Duganella sp. FT135W]|uniref:DUF4424 domain-containing protein n=1 Tax=Duganella flavida TaxID=2692175 RepID=A0A6L8KAU7_9BURK|nr:DUF4424 family protein [Duganella flavida]MYM22992.1 DUF4424 domain-containing protein [Duganella flavida]
MKKFWKVLPWLTTWVAGAALAVDVSPRVAVGGVIVTDSSAPKLVGEKLTLSPARVEAITVFQHDDGTSVTARMAFRSPVFGWDPEQAQDYRNIGPVEALEIKANGIPVSARLRQKALLDGRDITYQLRQAALSDEQIFRSFGDAETVAGVDLEPSQMAALKKLGALSGKLPAWKVAETSDWQQIFPAARQTTIEHRYQPLRGHAYATYGQHSGLTPDDIPVSSLGLNDEACLSEGAGKAVTARIRALLRQGAREVYVELHDIEYLIGKSAPIADFTLDIVKLHPDQIVSLCFPGKPVRINDNTLRFSLHHSTPPSRVIVNFYSISSTY